MAVMASGTAPSEKQETHQHSGISTIYLTTGLSVENLCLDRNSKVEVVSDDVKVLEDFAQRKGCLQVTQERQIQFAT